MQPVRIVFLGAVDEGKSSLIGRLLKEAKGLKSDEIVAATKPGLGLDLAAFTDGLLEESRDRKTIDVSYRYLRIGDVPHIWIDAPGHLEYFPNAIGASTQAQVAVLVISAEQAHTESLAQMTIHHLNLIQVLGIKQVVFAINKSDSVPSPEVALQAIKDRVGKYIDLASLSHAFFSISATASSTETIQVLLDYLSHLKPDPTPNTKAKHKARVKLMALDAELDLTRCDLRFIQAGAFGSQGEGFLVNEVTTLEPYQSTEVELYFTKPILITTCIADLSLGKFVIVDGKGEIQALGIVLNT